ncbi:MAG TPA: PKD domain-containing protein, partial [Puia sp.]|nr:PKD domain-containing protein [Puia sp.]
MRRRLLIASCLCLLGTSLVRAQAPGTDFSATPTSGCGPLAVKFNDLSTNGPLFWSWDFGNGQTSNLQNPNVVYGTPGTYTVTLIARNRDGSNAMRKTGYITVFPFPTVQFSSNLTLACSPSTIQFVDQSTPGQGAIGSWKWTLGDGSTSNLQNPTHTYTQPGYYTIGLEVTNSGGCTNNASITRYLRVISGIQPNFAWDQTSASCSAPFILNFRNQTAGPGNLAFNWSLGNGALPANSTDTNPSNITYPAAGNYSVNLQVTSSLGCTASLQKSIAFNGNNATMIGPTSVCVNQPAVFSNSSSPLPPVNTWDFGDGTTSDTANTTKTWNAVGSYGVKLVNHYASCADSTTQTVQVVNPPTPAFTATPTGGCKAPLTVQFTDKTVGATSWLWDFGDGQTSNQQTPSHTYNATGNFTVKLTVTGAGGCANTVTMPAYIKVQAPVVAIENANQLGACIAGAGAGANPTLNPVAIINSPSGVGTYNWSAPLSNEGSSTIANPSFTYPGTGNYSISLTITTPDGCTSNTATSTVSVGAPTVAAFTYSPNPTCGRGPVTFTSTNLPADYYIWDFGDGTNTGTVTTPSVVHAYSKISPPTYTVKLTLINSGCETTFSRPVTVNPPIPNFGFQVQCPNVVHFADSSLTDKSMAMTYDWDFGDGTPHATSTGVPPQPPAFATTHTYAAPGIYTVVLTVTDGVCGATSYSRNVTIAAVNADFSLPPT